MELLGWLVFVCLIIVGVVYIKNEIEIYFYKLKKKKISDERHVIHFDNIYSKRDFMTKFERYFYNIFVELEEELDIKVHPQVNLATIVKKEVNNRYISELFRNIDFAIFDKDYKDLLLLIEINDSTHYTKKRIVRDIKVEKILKQADIKLMKFYSNYPNKKDYVKNRIKQELVSLKKEK